MMPKIIVRNTAILITDYDKGDIPLFENMFSIRDRVTRKRYEFASHYDEEQRILYLPRGMDIWYIEKNVGAKAYIDKEFDQYDYIKDGVKLKYPPRDDKQKEAIRFLIGSGEYDRNKYMSQLHLNLNTGVGKTYTAITSAVYFEITPIMITYSVNWLRQWKDEIIKYTNMKPDEVLIIEGSANINRLLKMKDISKYKFYLISHSSINSYAKRYGWNKIGELFRHLKIGLKLIDEAHLNFRNIYFIDFYTNTYKTFYITATPARSDEEQNKIYSRYFKNVPSIELFDEEEDPHTKYIAILYQSHPTPLERDLCSNAYGLDRNNYANYVMSKENLYIILKIVLQMILKTDGKCLIYFATKNAINIAYKWILFNYPELYDNVGIFNSDIPTDEKEEIKKNKKVILTTMKSCGTAMDIKDLKITCNLAEPFKSHVNAKQALGRTRDNDTIYIEAIDTSFKACYNYYKFKKEIYEKYATEVIEIRTSDKELQERNSIIMSKRPRYELCKKMENSYDTVERKVLFRRVD